jgi:23S rRNA A2030 N6-methylase RlmJ
VVQAYQERGASLLADNVCVNFNQSDGFELAISNGRADLVFLDPPFTDREREWQLLAGTCMYLRDQGISFLAWYPYSWHTFPNWIVETTKCEVWEVFWAKCGARPSQNLKGCGMLVSEAVSAALHKARAVLEPLPACLGWDLRIRQPAA